MLEQSGSWLVMCSGLDTYTRRRRSRCSQPCLGFGLVRVELSLSRGGTDADAETSAVPLESGEYLLGERATRVAARPDSGELGTGDTGQQPQQARWSSSSSSASSHNRHGAVTITGSVGKCEYRTARREPNRLSGYFLAQVVPNISNGAFRIAWSVEPGALARWAELGRGRRHGRSLTTQVTYQYNRVILGHLLRSAVDRTRRTCGARQAMMRAMLDLSISVIQAWCRAKPGQCVARSVHSMITRVVTVIRHGVTMGFATLRV